MIGQNTVGLRELILRTDAPEFEGELKAWLDELRAEYPGADESRQKEIAQLVADGAVQLRSALPDWHLRWDDDDEEDRGLSEQFSVEELEEESARLRATLAEWGRGDLVAEAVEKIEKIQGSNLFHLHSMTMRREANVYWGNDYATGLAEAMLYGASMVTTNPVLVNLARKSDPVYWDGVRDSLRAKHPNYSPVDMAYALTIEVVLKNARLLRPLWEVSDGFLGYVSLQLSPKNTTDADQMVKEAQWVWGRLTEELGGVPNCVFKVPGTKAGIEVASRCVAEEMGVNVTVNFSLPQQIAFAAAIELNGVAPISFRTQMDGRLDDPIGEELQAEGVTDWADVKTWATTAIRQREYRLLSFGPERGGMGCVNSIPLPASGRGPWNILRSIHNEPEVPIFLTIFPNKQEEFDAEQRVIKPDGMWTSLPDGYLDKLYKSKLFRQAYEPDGMTVDEFDSYLPVVQTLTQFGAAYDEFLAWVSS